MHLVKVPFIRNLSPKRYKAQIDKTNYGYHIKLAKEFDIHFIDFNKYFIKNKTTSKYPLYPKYGCHWSYYGAYLAADSIIKYIEKERHIDMPDLYCNDIKLEAAQGFDYDAGKGMNLLFNFTDDTLAHPDNCVHEILKVRCFHIKGRSCNRSLNVVGSLG